MVNITGFAGYECEDVVLYLAKIVTALERKIVIVDRTEQESLMEIFRHRLIPEPGKKITETEYEGILITVDTVCYEEYDEVFLVFGYRLMHPKLYECHNLILVTDGVPSHASMLQKVGKWERRQCILIRDLVPVKHGETYLTMLAGAEGWKCCLLPLQEQDVRWKCSLGTGEHIRIQSLSAGMRQILMKLTVWILQEESETEIKKIMKKI